jgi:hypothetical protein
MLPLHTTESRRTITVLTLALILGITFFGATTAFFAVIVFSNT